MKQLILILCLSLSFIPHNFAGDGGGGTKIDDNTAEVLGEAITGLSNYFSSDARCKEQCQSMIKSEVEKANIKAEAERDKILLKAEAARSKLLTIIIPSVAFCLFLAAGLGYWLGKRGAEKKAREMVNREEF